MKRYERVYKWENLKGIILNGDERNTTENRVKVLMDIIKELQEQAFLTVGIEKAKGDDGDEILIQRARGAWDMCSIIKAIAEEVLKGDINELTEKRAREEKMTDELTCVSKFERFYRG